MSSGFVGAPAQAEGGGGQDNLKVFVCKYVGKPGVDEWLERYRRFWEERLDRLDDYLRQLQAKEQKPRKEKRDVRKKQP